MAAIASGFCVTLVCFNFKLDNVDDSITGGNIEDKKIDETANADLINEAATKIQSSYRGYAVRQNYSKKSQNIVENDVVEGDKSIEEAANDDVDANMANEAAIKIQSSYRGFADRKKYKALTDPSKHNKEGINVIEFKYCKLSQ